MFLIFQLYITAGHYEAYKPVSDREKELRA
jgi:hypothetical protein